MLNPGQSTAGIGTMFTAPSLTPLAHSPASNPTTTSRRSPYALAGAALGTTVAATFPTSAFAADPCSNDDLSIKDSYSVQSWFGANPELNKLVCQSPRPIETKIGQEPFDIFAPIKTPEATVDFVSSVLQVERPVGEVRDFAVNSTAVLGIAVAMYMIYSDYTKLVNLPGNDDPAASLKWASYINGLTVLGRLGTDAYVLYQLGGALSAGNVNVDVLYSAFTIWAAMSGVWSLVAKFSTQLAGGAIAFTNYFNRSFMTALPLGVYGLSGGSFDTIDASQLLPAAASLAIGGYMYGFGGEVQRKRTVFKEPTIVSGGIKQTNGKNVQEFIRSMFDRQDIRVGDEIRTDRSLEFTADAETILHSLNADASIKFPGMESKVDFKIVGASNFETILPSLQALNETYQNDGSNSRIAISGTHTEVIKHINVHPGEGEIVAGSTIQTSAGRKYLQKNLKVTAETGSILVLDGKLKVVENFEIDELLQFDFAGLRYGPLRDISKGTIDEDTVFSVSVTGLADEVIPSVARTVALRNMSDELIPLINQAPNALRRVSSRLLLKLVPNRVRHAVRNWLVPNALTVSLSVPAEKFDAVVNPKSLAAIEKLAVQNRWVGTLRDNPTIPIGVAQVSWFANGFKDKLTLRVLASVADRYLGDRKPETISNEGQLTDVHHVNGETYRYYKLSVEDSKVLLNLVETDASAVAGIQILKGEAKDLKAGLIKFGLAEIKSLSGESKSLKIRVPSPIAKKFLNTHSPISSEENGVCVYELSIEDSLKLAKSVQGDRKTANQIRIILDTPVMVANGLANLTEIEKIAGEAGPGSSMTYAEYLQRPKLSLIQGARMLSNTALPGLSYGRFGVIAGLVLSGAWMSFPLTSATKYLQGFEDPKVYYTSGKRIFLTSSLNRIFGPTIIAMVQESGYSSYKFYMPGMTFLTLWEISNEMKEADVTLFKQKVRDILGENRVEERIVMAKDLQEFERMIDADRPQHRTDIIKARLMNFMSTGVSTDRDADILVELYKSGEGDPAFEVDFLLAMMADDTFISSVVSNADAKAFFAHKISTRMNDIERRTIELGLEEAVEVLP